MVLKFLRERERVREETNIYYFVGFVSKTTRRKTYIYQRLPHRGKKCCVFEYLTCWPSEILFDKFVEYLIVRIKELLESSVGALLHLGLRSPFKLVETLVSDTPPSIGKARILWAAVETLLIETLFSGAAQDLSELSYVGRLRSRRTRRVWRGS